MATATTRLGLRKPDPADTINVAADLAGPYDKIDEAVGALVCTSGTRPASPFEGQLIWQTDTGTAHVYAGGQWLAVVSTPSPIDLTDGATINTDASLGNHFRVVLGGNRTLANPTNLTDGQKLLYELIQDGTGNRTITLGSMFQLGTDVASITLSTGANKRDFMGCVYRASTSKLYVVGFSKGY